jgi:hypothetical protein
VNLSAIIPITGAYERYWPRAWSELVNQVETGAPVTEVLIARPAGREPSVDRLAVAFERACGREPPALVECPLQDPGVPIGPVRNAALDAVSSRLVALMDVDDLLAPGIWHRLALEHARQPGLGSAAAVSIRRFPDGTIATMGAPAHRLRRPARLGPGSSWQQALLWRLSIESAVLAPAGAAVHATSVLRACGGYGRFSMEDFVLGAASVSCAPACYLPRLVGGLWEITPGSLWSRPHPREEVLAAHDELAERLRRLRAEGRLRPALARWPSPVDALLALRRRRLMRMLPPEGLSGSDRVPAKLRLTPGPQLRAWLEDATARERRMGELLA